MPLLIATLLMFTTAAHAQTFDTHDGCDAARWAEWRLILAELKHWPRERADAAKVRDLNRAICDQFRAGEISEAEADTRYQHEVD